MTRIVNVHEAKTHLSRLLESVREGEEIVIPKAGRPCARLVPVPADGERRKPGGLTGRLGDEFFDDLPAEEVAAWEG